MAFVSKVKKFLSVFGVQHKDLRSYTTSEKDMEKKKSKMPAKEFLLPDESELKTALSVEKKSPIDKTVWDQA